MDDLFFLGRLIFGGYFIYAGSNHFLSTALYTSSAAAKGVPMPEIAVLFAGALIVLGGLSIVLGLWPQIGAACIALFLIGVTPMMHNFWAISDPLQRTTEMGNFMKNVAMLGSALMTLGVPRPWPYSIEGRRRISV
jgi:putative oxidoreductase